MAIIVCGVEHAHNKATHLINMSLEHHVHFS
jgi:hypothetical protein